MSNVMIKMVNVQKKFGEQIVVDNLSLDVEQGEFLTLLGPSGCGKTTTLRMIAGFEQPSSGEILLDGEHMEGKAPYERNVNTVFQNYALFPHMNVYENIAFGLKMKKTPKDKIGDMVFDMLRLVQLEGYERRMPNQLSGGQKQRIAIARAVINKPKVLLLDEPLGALDLKLRKQMQVELKHLQRKLGITFIYVTHDQEEALTMSDRIAVMSEGVLQQVGMPDEIYERPVNRFVADFIGETNLFEGKVTGVDGEYGVITTQEGSINVLSKGLENGESVSVAIRPERLSVSYEKPQSLSYVCGRLKERIYVGSISKIVIELKSGKEVVVNETAGKKFDINSADSNIYVMWEAHNGVVMKG